MLPFKLIPQYRDYVWGGARLRPGVVPTAEAWVVAADNRIAAEPWEGKTLAEAAETAGEALLGNTVFQQTGRRFPLLIKLLDCAEWLSVQVHPDEAQATRLEGPGAHGKTEAWHVLEAEAGAQLIAGLKPGTDADALAEAIRNGTVSAVSRYLNVQSGDTLYMPAGTLHALGPGLLLYELQQAADVTYRVYDWGRPETEKRRLHIDKSLAVIDPDVQVDVLPLAPLADGERRTLLQCDYFTLETLFARRQVLELDTHGETFHALTAVAGRVEIRAGAETYELSRFETLFVPAACGGYQIRPRGDARLLKASVTRR